MKISVCLAAYHGEKYLKEQLDSVISQLPSDGEIIVSDDDPGGETERVVREYADTDKRIKYIRGRGEGVVKNFENALSASCGDVIFLCDQDDVWLDGKVERVTAEFSKGASLVLHDAFVTDESLNVVGESFFSAHKSESGFIRNIIRNSYMGCCMAFTRDVLEMATPFPENIPMHDQWIGLIAERYGKPVLLSERLILYRRHGGNVTGGGTNAAFKIKTRAGLLKALFCYGLKDKR
ncbi:MAG: glycosyltransferase family 2 protein [Clostridiales bacterium]|nr:glycosyltransferase family 2 protein [Clostridiales bacterium]